ncbi:MAG: polyprenol monophosphomannose synthase [Candidatus Micrarchaeota archaeon]
MISIVIPTYNEKDNLPILVKRIDTALKNNYQIVIVDDNSPDGTAKVALDLSKNYNLTLVKREGKLGLASAVIAGIEKAETENIIVMDADLSHPPEKLPEFVKALETSDLVIGSRNIEGGKVETWPIHRKIVSAGATLMANMLIGTNISDPMSGFFAIKKSILQNTKIKVKGYKILMNILAKNPKIKIKEIPYVFQDRLYGQTKLDQKEMMNYVLDLIKLKLG